MAVSRRARTVRNAVVPVFAAAGADGWGPVQELRGAPGVRLAATPRHATVLLVAGAVPDADLEALQRVHDQLPRPRTVVAWRPAGAALRVPATRIDGGLDEVVAALREAFARVTAEPATSAADLLPDIDPADWRGVGPFGQGGEGMMGGTPYGRPMAMTGDDRDGLALDQLQLTLGPFLDALPPGLELDVVLQGDVLQEVTPRVTVETADPDPWLPADPALAAARHGLRWLAHALHVEGLDALAARAGALASRVADDADRSVVTHDAVRLSRRVRRTGVLQGLRGVGGATAGTPHGLPDGDVAGSWRARMEAIVTALRDGAPSPALRPTPPDACADLLARLLDGMTVTDAVSTIVSLDVGEPRVRAAVTS